MTGGWTFLGYWSEHQKCLTNIKALAQKLYKKLAKQSMYPISGQTVVS